MKQKKTIIQLNIPELIIIILSLLFGGFSIAGKVFGELNFGYLYASLTILAAGTLLLKARKKIQINS